MSETKLEFPAGQVVTLPVDMSECEAFWAGPFGTEYLKRNRVEWKQRVPFWNSIIQRTGAQSVLEVGCNAGWNLSALRSINGGMRMIGVDVNRTAIAEANAAGFDAREFPAAEVGKQWPQMFDLVCTVGCLIHVPPEDLSRTMASVIAASKSYVLAVEYASFKEEEVDYRGNEGKLWKRPFGKMYEFMGLEIMKTMHLDAAQGFDRCTAWLCKK